MSSKLFTFTSFRLLRCHTTQASQHGSTKKGIQDASATLKRWLKGWDRATPPATPLFPNDPPPTALAWLRRRGPPFSIATIHKLFRQGIVRAWLPDAGTIKRIKPDGPLPHGAVLLLPTTLRQGHQHHAPSPMSDVARKLQAKAKNRVGAHTQTSMTEPSWRDRMGKHLLNAVLLSTHDFVALNKPAGLAVQGGKGVHISLDTLLPELQLKLQTGPPQASQEQSSLSLNHQGRQRDQHHNQHDHQQTYGYDTNLRLVHRLDRETTGVLLLAKGRDAAARLGTAFARDATSAAGLSKNNQSSTLPSVKKTYWAIVRCHQPSLHGSTAPHEGGANQRENTTRASAIQSSGQYVHATDGGSNVPNHPDDDDDDATVALSRRDAMWSSLLPASGQVSNPINGAEATTYYKVLARNGPFAWIELRPMTGRKHQLRIHAAHGLGAPILGDARYGGESVESMTSPYDPQSREILAKLNMSLARENETANSDMRLFRSKLSFPLFLHCRSLEVRLPGRKRAVIIAPASVEWGTALCILGWNRHPKLLKDR